MKLGSSYLLASHFTLGGIDTDYISFLNIPFPAEGGGEDNIGYTIYFTIPSKHSHGPPPPLRAGGPRIYMST